MSELPIITEEELVLQSTINKLDAIVPGLYPSWRKGQLEVADKIAKSSKKFIAVQAPTGVGKSVIAAAVMVKEGGKGRMITQTKQLGDQYYRDFWSIGLKTVKGRPNFKCNILPDKMADEAPCSAGLKCPLKWGGCEYYDQKRDAVESNLSSMNIHYYLSEVNYSGEFAGSDILFIDEAHKLESALFSFIEVVINKKRFEDNKVPVPSTKSLALLKLWAERTLATLIPEFEKAQNDLEEDIRNDIARVQALNLRRMVSQLENFTVVDETWVLEDTDRFLKIKPIMVNNLASTVVFSHARKVILMSATLPRSVMSDLGIVDYDYIDMESTFPSASRPIIWLPVANLARSAEKPEVEMNRLIAAIDGLIEKFPNQNAIIHTVNYRINEAVIKRSRFKNKMLSHSSAKEREATLNAFSNSPIKSGTILVSPSFTEGVDLPYEKVEWQIITKIPYAHLGNPQVKARSDVDQKWYFASAIIQLIQAYGRIMRAEDDSGVTYILDKGLLNLINRWRSIFDQVTWFLESLHVPTLEGKGLILFNEWENSNITN